MKYQMRGLDKYAEEDNWSEGGGLGNDMQVHIQCSFYGNTVEEIIDQVRDFTNAEDIELNACEERGRVDLLVNETGEGLKADESDWERFKAGKQKQYYCIYTGIIERVETVDLKGITVKEER